MQLNLCGTEQESLTAGKKESTFADAVVIVHIFGAEIRSVYYQTTLPTSRSTVILQNQPERQRGYAHILFRIN